MAKLAHKTVLTLPDQLQDHELNTRTIFLPQTEHMVFYLEIHCLGRGNTIDPIGARSLHELNINKNAHVTRLLTTLSSWAFSA